MGSVDLSTSRATSSGRRFRTTRTIRTTSKIKGKSFNSPTAPSGSSQGTSIAVAAPARVAQFELFLPELDSPGDFPQFLSFGGTLKNDNLGTSFTTIRFDEALPFVAQPGEPQVPPLPFDVVYDNGTIRITLTFGLNVALVFSG